VVSLVGVVTEQVVDMIVECLALSAVAIVALSLRFTRWLIRHEDDLVRDEEISQRPLRPFQGLYEGCAICGASWEQLTYESTKGGALRFKCDLCHGSYETKPKRENPVAETSLIERP
jgi:hypothetical protein